jgi:hypothetical protein
MKLGSVLFVMLLASGTWAGAQSLGEMAQKEKEKREAKAKEGTPKTGKKEAKAPEAKVYTTDDLAGYAEKDAPPSESGDVAEGASPRSGSADDGAPAIKGASEEPRASESDDSAARAREERSWRQRAQAARAAITAAERELAAAEKAKAALGIGPQVDDPDLRRAFNDRVREADQRLTRAKGAVATAKTDQANLEEEARRSGAMPGWLR